jgi:ATP-binding cassette, subfamily C, bacterial
MLARHLRSRPRDAGWLAFWSLVQALPMAVSGWSLAEATGRFQSGHALAGLAWLGLLGVAAAAGALGTRQVYLRAGAIVEPLRDDLVTAIVSGALARSTADSAAPPDTKSVARLTHQAEIVRDCCAGLLVLAATFAFSLGSAVIGLATLVPATLPFVVPPVLASIAALWLLLRPTVTRQRAAVLAEEDVAADVAQAVTGVRDITACGGEEQVLATLASQVARQCAAGRAVAAVASARVLCLAAGGWLPLVIVLAVAPGLLRHGVSPAALIGVVTYIAGSMRAALGMVAQGMGAGLVRLRVTLDRIGETGAPQLAGSLAGRISRGDEPSIPPYPAGGVRAEAAALAAACHGGIELREVRFGYGPGAAPVLDGLSLRIPAGDHLAVVGPSGIGKSSLAALVAGLLRPGAGEILLGGVPVARCGHRWRVVIPQEAYVFGGTVRENLTYFGDAGQARLDTVLPDTVLLDTVAAEIGLAPLVARLGGYDARIAPAGLSAGERQLIALARAYLAPAPVAILDEATCHLDPAAEERAEAAFARRGGTLIVIAHRITSARRAKRILVLDGVRAQAGVHEELLVTSPMYRDLAGYWTATRPQASSPAAPSPQASSPAARG